MGLGVGVSISGKVGISGGVRIFGIVLIMSVLVFGLVRIITFGFVLMMAACRGICFSGIRHFLY